MKSKHPALKQENILASIFGWLPKADLENTKLVCKDWNAVTFTPTFKLLNEFNLPIFLVSYLQSPDIVYRRLSKIMARGKIDLFQIMTHGKTSIVQEHELYQLYCASGSINEDFVHLLDDDEKWFNQYFNKRDAFFIALHVDQAFVSGNLVLVKYLIEKENYKPQDENIYAAAGSGEFDLLQYLLEIKKYKVSKEAAQIILYKVILSGNVDALKYIIKKLNIHPDENYFAAAVCCGSLKMVQYLHQQYHFTANNISIFEVEHARSLKIVQYLIENMGWLASHPMHNRLYSYMGEWKGSGIIEGLTRAACRMGIVEMVKYVEKKFSYTGDTKYLLSEGIRSGNWDVFAYLLHQSNITFDNFKDIIFNHEDIFRKAVLSGNLGIVKFLIEQCKVKPPTVVGLPKYVIKSNSVEIARYLLDNYHYKVTHKELKAGFYEKNLALISFLFDRCQSINSDSINKFCRGPVAFLQVVYHLITKKNYRPDATMLQEAFDGYLFNHEYGTGLFIEYLLHEHHLPPTKEMVAVMQKEGHTNSFGLFHKKRAREEESYAWQCRIV